LVQVDDIYKSFDSQRKRTEVLKGIRISISQGEAVAIVGASGVGKSTFLYLVGTLDRPTAGKIYFRGEDVFAWKEEKLVQFAHSEIRLTVVKAAFTLMPMMAKTNGRDRPAPSGEEWW
jgi:lipoprotein-releasing system ATP-binding protein